MDKEAVALQIQAKSVAVAVILTILFGSLGLFYASILGGIMMSLVLTLCWIITVLTLGLGIVFVILGHIICVIWTILAVQRHNTRLVSRIR